jgi:hypothetical protein
MFFVSGDLVVVGSICSGLAQEYICHYVAGPFDSESLLQIPPEVTANIAHSWFVKHYILGSYGQCILSFFVRIELYGTLSVFPQWKTVAIPLLYIVLGYCLANLQL